MHLEIDSMVLTDTRHREITCKSYTPQVKSLLGPHTRNLHHTVLSFKTKKGSQNSSVGEQLVIIAHSWAGALINHFHDPSNLGLVSGIYFATGKGSLLAMGDYWPFPSADPNLTDQQLLWARTSQYLISKMRKKSPKEYVQYFITKHSDWHITKSEFNTTILCVTLITDGTTVNISLANGLN